MLYSCTRMATVGVKGLTEQDIVKKCMQMLFACHAYRSIYIVLLNVCMIKLHSYLTALREMGM